MRKTFLTLAVVCGSLSIAAVSHAEELAVDEPLNANARQNIRPVDYLVVDRAYDLFADPRVHIGDAPVVVPTNGAATNAKIRAASRPVTTTTAPTGK